MSDALLNAGRQTLMLELQEASRLPERLGDDFVRAANIIIHCEGKVIVSGIGKSGHIGKKIAAIANRLQSCFDIAAIAYFTQHQSKGIAFQRA